MTKLTKYIPLLLFYFLTMNSLAQDTLYSDFYLISKNKIKTIYSSDEIDIISTWRWNSDSSQISLYPQPDSAFCITKGVFVVRPKMEFYQRIYKNNPVRTIKDYKINSTYIVRLPISEIDKIKVKRQFIQLPTGIIGFLALTSAVIVAPIVSIDKKFNISRFKNVAGYSLATATTMLAINLAFGTKTYHIKKHKHRKTWTLN